LAAAAVETFISDRREDSFLCGHDEILPLGVRTVGQMQIIWGKDDVEPCTILCRLRDGVVESDLGIGVSPKWKSIKPIRGVSNEHQRLLPGFSCRQLLGGHKLVK
jgi:hypothetical protein